MQRPIVFFILTFTCVACTVAPSVPARALLINERVMMAAHNEVRAPLGLPSLRWSERLVGYAQAWANTLAKRQGCSMLHRSELGKDEWQVGENLFWSGARRWTDGRRELEPITPRRATG